MNKKLSKFTCSFTLKLAALISLSGLSSMQLIGCASNTDQHSKLLAQKTPVELIAYSEQQLQLNKTLEAIQALESLSNKQPHGELYNKSQLLLAYSYQKHGEPKSALSVLERFIRYNPEHPRIDYAYYLQGVVYFELNASSKYKLFKINRAMRDQQYAKSGFDAFKYLLTNYPKSQYFADAKQRLIKLKNQLAEHELTVMQHYVEHKAYLSAINRGNYLIHYFDDSSSVIKALELLAFSYEQLGLDNLAQKAKSLLQDMLAQQLCSRDTIAQQHAPQDIIAQQQSR